MGVLTPCMPVAQFVCIASRGRKKALDPMERSGCQPLYGLGIEPGSYLTSESTHQPLKRMFFKVCYWNMLLQSRL